MQLPKGVLLLIFSTIALNLQCQLLTLKDIFLNNKYQAERGTSIKFMNASSDYTTVDFNPKNECRQIIKHNLSTGASEVLFSEETLRKVLKNEDASFEDYFFTDDDKYLLLSMNEENIFRRSVQANYYYHKIGSKKIEAVSENGKQLYPTFSPTNDRIAFVRDNDIYIKDLSDNSETRVTTDGEINAIINGKSDWVYEEEFSLTRAYEWSPDGNHLLYLKFDERDVPEFSYTNYGSDLYPKIETFKYPKVGEKNAKLSLHLYDVKKHTNADVQIVTDDSTYIPRIKWLPSGDAFSVMVLNRWQNHLIVLSVNKDDFNTKIIYEEKDNSYIELPEIYAFLKDNTLVISSEKKKNNNVYFISDENEKLIGNHDLNITSIYGIDEKNNEIFFQAYGDNIEEKHLFKVNYKTNKVEQLSKEKGSHSANFSGDFSFYKHIFSADGIPPIITLESSYQDQETITIENNSTLKKETDQFWNEKEFFKIPLEDYELPAYMIKPDNFDKEKKYPVLMFVYGGPGSQSVTNSWGGNKYFWFQYLANNGFIIVCVDNRGTGGNGAEFKKCTYLKLGQKEAQDQVAAANYLKENFPFVHNYQVSIFGWSYGGFLSSLSLFEGGNTFKSAISVAPVTNWKFYDTIYSERYMKTPKENPSGYAYAPISCARKMENDLLLIHGTADDNVHFQNTIELIKELNSSGKDYELLIYPNKAHGIGGRSNQYHLFKNVTDFLLDRL